MTQTYKLALLTALGLTGLAGTIQAQSYVTGDLLVGIYEPSAANTLVVDLGKATAITGQSFVQWNLTSDLAAAGITVSGATEFGVVGATQAGNPQSVWASGVGSATWTSGNTAAVESSVNTIGQYISSSGFVAEAISGGNGSDWYNQTVITPPTGLNATVVGDINSLVGSPETLYESTGSYSAGRPPVAVPGSEVTDLTFNLNPTTDVLTYGSPVPEPSTYALLAGSGLLVLAWRKLLVRKQA